MRRIVAPAGIALSTLFILARAATYLINGILKLGQSITHVCELPTINGRERLFGLVRLSAVMHSSLHPTQSGRGAGVRVALAPSLHARYRTR
jgi:hypothetical protein